ncbi:hypothetical protein IU433_30255 [Nocardia puris]|uniref:DUF5997 family protein n=1 Tax=Nocardia puris TaxID=208602 RepID=UPI0018954DD7|nr:DUF5997 family protein [Nocardia puris]MBF6215473.1 hypothetical protein [Nocardia puris]MBF6369087.1 hypothetical protein [Nocardia puris]MBF6463288.1 hypothetical protein [Nocardia puris]
MSSDQKPQMMKPLTAANKLGIHLPAAPEEFRNSPLSRADLERLRTDPPAWLTELRRTGPFPRDITARKLGVTNSGLARAGVSDALTADEIAALLADPPEWLVRERENYAAVQQENERIEAERAERRAASNRPPKNRFGPAEGGQSGA